MQCFHTNISVYIFFMNEVYSKGPQIVVEANCYDSNNRVFGLL